MHLYYAECAEWQLKKSVFSSCLKLLLLSARPRRLAGSQYQTIETMTEKEKEEEEGVKRQYVQEVQ